MVAERVVKAGNTNTIIQGRLTQNGKKQRANRDGETTLAQKEGNLRRATMRLTWLMNENFRDGDYLVTLDYRKECRPEDAERTHKDFKNFFDRVKRRLKREGIEIPKYIRVIEIGKKGAWHHHFVINEIPVEVIRECWAAGGIHIDPLYTDGNYRRIAEYFVKYSEKTADTGDREIKKLWYPSRGLRKPKVGAERIIRKRNFGQVRVPRGYYLDQESVRAGMSRYDGHEVFSYMVVRLPEKKRSGSGRKGKKAAGAAEPPEKVRKERKR